MTLVFVSLENPPLPIPGKRTGHKSGVSPVVWAVPVAIVGLIFVLLMAYFIRKSRRLEHSMFALMSRRTADDDGGVTFHSGIDLLLGCPDGAQVIK